MAIQPKMDALFATNVTVTAVHQFWTTCRNHREDLVTTIAALDQIATEPKIAFSGIDSEITAEAIAVLQILKTCKTDLDKHMGFIGWTEPQ